MFPHKREGEKDLDTTKYRSEVSTKVYHLVEVGKVIMEPSQYREGRVTGTED